jgi:hypothetical protein
MFKRVIIPGLLGGIVMLVWAVVVNGLLGFKFRIDMNQVANESVVYEVLKESITEPGRYVCNPQLTAERRFPEGEPVFSILYGGMGHEAAGTIALVQLPLFFLAPILAAWMLSCGSRGLLTSYRRKVSFFTAIGLLLGVTKYLTEFGIGSYPVGSAVILAAHEVVLWTVVGLVVAWKVKVQEQQAERVGSRAE